MKKILILSHQGMGFVEKLVQSANQIGCRYHILSSESADGQLSKPWRESAWTHTISHQGELTFSDIADLHSLEHFDCCITVWDAYRGLMAQANDLIGAKDLALETVDLIQDKYLCRRAIFEAGLSDVSSYLLSEIESSKINIDDCQYFVKPRRGAGSYFASSVRSNQQLDDIARDFKGRSNATEPSAFQGFLIENQLYVEQFIDGTEFSFEVIVSEGEIRYGVEHEKIMGTDDQTDVAIECAFFSPSLSVNQQKIHQAYLKIASVFKLFSIDSGCFHVELRHTPKEEWELVEINLRIGGAYIDESVQYRLNRHFLVEQLALLMGLPSPTVSNEKTEKAVYFEIAFAQAGQKIEAYSYNPHYPKHDLESLFCKPGEVTDNTKAEIMCGQHLWLMNVEEQTAFQQSIKEQRYLQINGSPNH